MKIGLIDVDSHNWPNLCLMKLFAYHKAQGNQVAWWNPAEHYDLVYKSRVFDDTYSKDNIIVTNTDRVIKGGTGYGISGNLPDAVEHICPDYTLSPQFSDIAYGFLTRGCPRRCKFCLPERLGEHQINRLQSRDICPQINNTSSRALAVNRIKLCLYLHIYKIISLDKTKDMTTHMLQPLR